MSAFKDAVAADIKRTFINPLEFAEWHDVNGTEVLCVVDSDIMDERKSQGSGNFDYAPGVFTAQKKLYIDAIDVARPPVEGELFRLDGERYLVDEVVINDGVLEITIEANET